MINKIFINIILLIFFFNNVSFGIELQGNFAQGGLIKGKIEPGSKVFLDKKQIKVSSNGYFVFGIEKNRKQNILLEVHNNGEKKVLERK
jgi:hypothetical protein